MSSLRTRLESNLGLAIALLLFVGCFLVLMPFMTALLWAIILSFSSAPLYRYLLNWLGKRRTLAALIMLLGMFLVVLFPVMLVGVTLAENVSELKTAAEGVIEEGPPAPPQWVDKIPLVGHPVTERWVELSGDRGRLREAARRFVEPVATWLLGRSLALGGGLLQLALSILITFFLLRDGPFVLSHLRTAVQRIAGERGRHLLKLAGDTVRGVVYGILGTALVQGVMAGVGFFVAGVPGPVFLGMLTFFLSVIPLGPPLIWLPAAIWLFHNGNNGWGTFMIIWGLGVSTIDNFVKPWLISQGSDMPFLLILFGVLGGALAFGFIGVFIGPTLLAVGYRLFREWVTATPAADLA